jgi:hypothetical protein
LKGIKKKQQVATTESVAQNVVYLGHKQNVVLDLGGIFDIGLSIVVVLQNN